MVTASSRKGSDALLAKSAAGRSVRWARAEIVLEPSEPPRGISMDELREALIAGARTWNQALEGCSVPKVRVAPTSTSTRRVARDGVSVVVVRSGRWCPDAPRDASECYDPRRAALTRLYPIDPPGLTHAEIREADMEINAVDFEWSLDGSEPRTRSLVAAIAHELGHLLGLDHPCAPSPAAAATARTCLPEDREAIMYPAATEPGRAPVLAPLSAEVRALCALYQRL